LQLNVLTPELDVEILQAAGFTSVTPFYQGFTWRGWVGYAG
jgi:tRNA (cmo5U34)-methyltransferase